MWFRVLFSVLFAAVGYRLLRGSEPSPAELACRGEKTLWEDQQHEPSPGYTQCDVMTDLRTGFTFVLGALVCCALTRPASAELLERERSELTRSGRPECCPEKAQVCKMTM